MRNIFVISVFVVFFQSCDNQVKQPPESKSREEGPNYTSNKRLYWYDSLIIDYLGKTNNELVRASVQDSLVSEDWLFDRIEEEGASKYMVFQIGHDVSDSGETNMRFVTDSWVYIDSMTHKLYEYDIINDSLIK